jgi:hypothetical protein
LAGVWTEARGKWARAASLVLPMPMRSRPNKPYKARQLCAQVAETLDQVLAGECGDDLLSALRVVSVAPAPHSGQLLVVVAPVLPDEPLRPADVQRRLEAAAGRLRTLVAECITRKRAPRLMFQFVTGDGFSLAGPGEPPSGR